MRNSKKDPMLGLSAMLTANKGHLMSTKGIFTAAIAATAILTGLASYTSATFSTKIEQKISHYNSIEGIEASIIDRHNGFFSRQQSYKIVVSAQYLQNTAQIPGIDQDIEVYIPHSFVGYPLYVTSELNIDLTRGSVQKLLTEIGLDDIPHQLSVGSNLLLQTANSTLDVPALSVDKAGVSFVNQGIKITTVSDIAFEQGNIITDFSGVKMDMGERGFVSMSGLNSDSAFSTVDDIMIITAMSGKLDKFAFRDNNQATAFSGENITTSSEFSSLDQDLISLVADMNIANMSFKSNAGDYLVTNTEFLFSVSDIDKSSYIELEKISRQMQPSPETMKSVLMKLAQQGGKANLSKLNFKVNDVQMNSSADFVLPSYQGTLAESELNQHMAENFVMDIALNLSNNYGHKFEQLGSMVEQFVQRGMATKDRQGNISSNIKFNKGQLTANDTPIQM